MVATPIPEPETYALMFAGLGLVGWVASRRRKVGV
ncbi:MAG: PEP-CTERM sorting domain-containing protein [Burkholderiales bacterium]